MEENTEGKGMKKRSLKLHCSSLLLVMMSLYFVIFHMETKNQHSRQNVILLGPNTFVSHAVESRFKLRSDATISNYDQNTSNMDPIVRTIVTFWDSILPLASATNVKTEIGTVKTSKKIPTFKLWEQDTTEEDICSNPSVYIIAIVPSAVENLKQRSRIRQSWASRNLFDRTKIRAVFVLGATNNETLQTYVNWEAKHYRDIIQSTIIDSYRNLTYKSLSALSWISENCHGPKWVAKIDDDVVVNPFNLIHFLKQRGEYNSSFDVIMGDMRSKAKVNKSGKWRVTKKEFPHKHYPRYTIGSAYIMERTVVDKLLPHAINTPFFWIEDVYVTGLLATAANISRSGIKRGGIVIKPEHFSFSKIAIFYIAPKNYKLFEYFWDKIQNNEKK